MIYKQYKPLHKKEQNHYEKNQREVIVNSYSSNIKYLCSKYKSWLNLQKEEVFIDSSMVNWETTPNSLSSDVTFFN